MGEVRIMDAPVAPAAAQAEADPAIATAMAELFLPQHRADPYGPAARLRAAAPLHQTPLGLFLVTRYADCAAVLQSTAWSHANEAAQLHPSVSAGEAAEELPTSFLWMD